MRGQRNMVEKKEQEIGNLSEKITKENFPNLVKETDIKSRKHTATQLWWMQSGPLQDTKG